MPIHNTQYAAQGKTPDGQTVQIPGKVVLVQRGPIIQVALELSDQVAQELVTRKEPLPAAVAGWALIDTGSIFSCVDEEVAKAMSLPTVGVVKLGTASHASHSASQHPIKITFQGIAFAVNIAHAIEAPLKAQGLVAIIGRDVLQNCVLTYNGPLGIVTLGL